MMRPDCFVFSRAWAPQSGLWLKVMKFQVYQVPSQHGVLGTLIGQSLQHWKLTSSNLEKALEMLASVPQWHWPRYDSAVCCLQNWIFRYHRAFVSLQRQLYFNSSSFYLVCKMDHWKFWLASHVILLWTWASAFSGNQPPPYTFDSQWSNHPFSELGKGWSDEDNLNRSEATFSAWSASC